MLSFSLFVAAVCLLHPAEPNHRSAAIVLDAKLDDWGGVSPTLIDPADAPESAVDFGELRITHDGRFVHLLLDFGRTVNAQGLNGTAMILLDADGDPRTGSTQHQLPGV